MYMYVETAIKCEKVICFLLPPSIVLIAKETLVFRLGVRAIFFIFEINTIKTGF